MNRASRIRMATAAGALAGSIIGAAITAGAAVTSAPPAPAAQPARVAVISRTLDVFETGSTIGPGVLKGVASAAVTSQSLPAPANQAQHAVLDAINQASTQITTNGPAGIDQLRVALAPLACANPAVNAAVKAVADGLDTGALTLGGAIQPFDLAAHQTATLLRGFQTTDAGC
ncbi:MAG: hypothetical protein ACR2LQ_09340 [Acidimicrobiales bacterium]